MPTVASDAEQFLTAIRYQFRYYLRTSRFIGLATLGFLIGLLLLVVIVHAGAGSIRAGESDSSVFLAGLLGFASFVVTFIAAFFGGDGTSMDTGSAAGYYMLPLPVRREVLLLGRFVAAFAASFAAVMVFYGMLLVDELYVWGTIPSAVAGSIALTGLLCLAVLALAFFFSSLFRSPLVGILVTILLVIIVLPIATAEISQLTPVTAWYMINVAAVVVALVFTQDLGSFWWGILSLFAYIAVFLPLSLLLFHYREVQG